MGKSRAEYMRDYRQKKREEKLKSGKVQPKRIARNSTQRTRDFRARAANLSLSQTLATDPTISGYNVNVTYYQVKQKKMDAEPKIKDKLEDLQRFRPLLEEMLKWSKVGEKNAAAREKLQKMYEIVIGQTPCTKLGNLIRIEEAILKWTQKKKESVKEPPVILNRLQHLKKRVAALQSLKNTELNQTSEPVENSKPIEVISLDSSDEDDIQIVSYTSPEPKKDKSEVRENNPSNKTDENKPCTSSSLKPELKDEDENPFSELEDGEIEDSDSIISIVDGTGIELEDVENNFSKEKEHIPKEIEVISKRGIEDLSKEAEHLYEEDEFSSLDSLASYHDKPALKTYGCRKISKTDKNENNGDLRNVLNAIRMSKKQNTDEPNISEVGARTNANEPLVATSLGKLPTEETLVVEIRNRKTKVKKHEDDRVVNSNIPLREKIKSISEDNKSLKTSSVEKETENPQSILKKRVVRVIEIVTEEPKEGLIKNTMETIEQKTKLFKPKLVDTSDFENLSGAEIIGSNQDAIKKRSFLTKEHHKKSSDNDKTETKPDESHFDKKLVEKDSEENKISSTENKKRHCEKNKKSTENNEDIPIAAEGSKSDISSVANNTNNRKTEKSAKDKYLDILYNIDLTPDSENELEKDQDLDIFDEAIYSGTRRNSEAGQYKRAPDVSRAEVSDRTNIPYKNEDIASSTLVKQNNYEKRNTTTASQSDLTMKQANSNILPSTPDSGVVWLHDSDTEEFIKKINLVIDSKAERKSVEDTSKEKLTEISIHTHQPTTKDKLPVNEEIAIVEKVNEQISTEQKASEIEYDPKSPTKNGIQTVEESINQIPFAEMENSKILRSTLLEGDLGNTEQVLSTEKNVPNTDNDSNATSKILSKPFSPSYVVPSNSSSTNSTEAGFKPITQEMLNDILVKIKETLKKSQSKLENSTLESEIQQESARDKVFEPEHVDEKIKKAINLSMELATFAKASIGAEAVSPQSEKPLFERRPQKKESISRVIEAVQKSINHSESTENRGASFEDRTNASREENKTIVEFEDANAVVPQGQTMTSKVQLDEWANKDLSELQEIRMKLEKQLGVDLETILQADQDEESIFSSDNEVLAMDVAQELEEAMQDDFLDELPEPEIPTFTCNNTPINFFAQSNFPISYNLPQYLGLPPEIQPNDPRLRSRLTLLYAKTTDPMQLKTPLFKRKPSVPTADEILGSQAGKVQEEIHSACMKEVGELNFQTAPKTTIHKNQRIPSTSSSNRPQARTYGEYKRLKQAAIQAEAARKRAAVEAANRAHQMELEAERERQKTLDTEKKRLRFNEFENSQDYETDADIILATRKRRSYILSSSSESESQPKKSPTKQRLRKKRIRVKSPQFSSENEIGQIFSIDSDTIDSTSNPAKFPSRENHEDTCSSNVLENLLNSHNLAIDTNNKERLKELAFTVMKSLLKEKKFEEFKKLLDSNVESNEKTNKKAVSPFASTSSKGEISNRELAALNKDLHDMFIRDDVLMIGKRKSSVRSLKRIEEHYKSTIPTKASVSETAKEDSDKVIRTVYSDEDADTDNFEEYTIQKKQNVEIINMSKNCPTVKLKRLTQEEILQYTQLGHPDNSPENTEDDQNLLEPMKAVPFSQGVARRQSQSSRPKKETQNTNPNWHYKDPYYSKYCLICYKKFSNLVDHYVIQHPKDEIYIARLPQSDLLYLAENPGKANTVGEQNKKGQLKYNCKCFFCEQEMTGRFDKFSHHYASHTGEFPYECSACDFMSCFKSVATKHSKRQCKKDAKVLTYYAYDENATKINLYVCAKCNYMQLHKANVVLHLRKEHGYKFVCESDVKELLLLEHVEQNIEIVNEPVSTVPKADDVEIIFEIQTGSKIDLPIVKTDKDSETDSIISDISIDMKPGSFELDMLPNQLTIKNTSIAPDLSKFDAQGEQIVTVIHLPASVSNTTENKSGDKSNFEKLLEELNSTASTSTQHVEPLVVAKPKRNSVPEPVLKELIQVKSEQKEESAESKQEDHKTDQIKDNHINVDKSIKPNVSDSSTIETSPKEIKIKEEETNPLSEDIGVEEGQDSFITVIEIVNDDDETQIDLPINEPHPEPKVEEEFATDLPINEPHPEPKVEEEFAPLRIEHFGYQEIRKGEFLFHCLIDKCNFGVTVLFEVLQNHACADHDIKWSGKCNICKNELNTSTGSQPIEEELNHMLTVHIKELPESENDDENHVQKLLKPWLSEIKSRKHKILCEAMQSEKSLSCLYKCMGNNCSFTAETKLQMSRHLAAHELSILRNPDPERSWLECSYCEFVAVKTLQILEHIDFMHSKSIFQCSRCFYRSCSSVNLEIHHDQYHHSNADKNKTIKCSGQLKRLKDEVERINKLAAQNIEALSCSVCGAGYIRRDIMIRHLQEAHKEIGIPKGFPMGLFSCIFCKFETDGLEEIRSHMANKHPDELLYIGVRGIGEKSIKKDIATIAYIGVEEKDDDDSQFQTSEPDMELSELTKSDLKKKYETFKKNLMSVRVLEKLCNPSITIDSDDESCGNEDAEVSDESTIVLYQKLIEMLKYFIKSQSELNPCCICLEKINLEDQWDNHFKTTHGTVNLNAFQMCPLCPTLCSFWTYPSHYINIHNKRTKTYFCYFCGKNFNILSVAKLHLISHSVYEQAKLIRVKMKQDVNTVNSNKNDIDYQIILPRKYNRKITDIIKHMMGVLEKRKIAERQMVKAPVDLDNFTIDLNENIRGLNYPLYVAAPMRYVCTYCSVQLTDERTFEQHFKLYHSAFKVFKCPHCEVTLFNVNDFDRIRDHIRIHSGIFYMCSFCKMYTSNRIHLIEHLKRYKRDSVPIVVYARTAVTVKHHFEIIHLAPLSKASGIKIKCLFCTMFEGSPKDLGEHLQNIHEFIRQYQCDYCAFRGDEENVDMHVIKTHVKNMTGNINYGFRSKTIFQKNFNTNKYVKKKSDDFVCLPESSSPIEKKYKLEDSIIELNCEDKTEKPQSSGAPLKISVITDLPVQEFPINVPPAQSSLVENSIKEMNVKVPTLQELTVKDAAKEISVKETPVEDSPNIKLITFSRSLKCEFCPLKCTNNDDLMKHLNLRHGVTLLETSENYNQSVAAANVTSTITTTAAESTSLTKETRKSADLTSLEPPQKKIRLVPLEKLLDPKAKGTQIEHIAPKPAPIQIVQNPREQILIQQPNKINITQSTPLQAPTGPEYQTYVCKFTCFHCSAKFATQDQLAAHWQSALSCPAKWSIFICYHCNIQFSNFKLLAAHWGQTCSTNLVNGSYRYRISGNSENQLPDIVTNSFLEAMSKLPFSKSICFQCPDCSQAYFDQQICMNHIKTKMQTPYYCTYTQEIILYGCDECKVFFLKERDAVRHISKHTFQFGCLFCQCAYKTRDELYAHYVEFHRSIERRHRCNAMSEPNMEIYREMLVVFPYGLILTKWNLRDTILGNMNLFARLIEEVTKENNTTAVQK